MDQFIREANCLDVTDLGVVQREGCVCTEVG